MLDGISTLKHKRNQRRSNAASLEKISDTIIIIKKHKLARSRQKSVLNFNVVSSPIREAYIKISNEGISLNLDHDAKNL